MTGCRDPTDLWGRKPAGYTVRQNGRVATRVAFFQHSNWDRPGIFGDRARELGWDVARFRVDRMDEALPEVDDFDVLVTLGSAASVTDPSVAWIPAERRLVTQAVEAGQPVLGVCFGGQLLAQVLGGEVHRASQAEVGWHLVETDDPSAIPPGPWVTWHEDEFVVPPGADVIARTEVSPHAFIQGTHTGVQFHPEATAEIVDHWITGALHTGSVSPEEVGNLRDGFLQFSESASAMARTLFDGFVHRAGLLGASRLSD